MSLIGWLTGEDAREKAADKAAEIAAQSAAQQKTYMEQGLKAYTDYMDNALKSTETGQDKAIAAQLAGAQAATDLARQGAAQQMSWNLPKQAASLSALQALPQMQALLGMPAYNIPTTIDTSVPGAVNLASLYANAQNTLGAGGAGTSTGGTSTGTTGASSYNLTPYTGKVMDVTASPLFQWQNKQMQENVNRSLAAKGYGSSPAASAIMANEYAKLTGNETDKLYNRLQNMLGVGTGTAGLSGTTSPATAMAATTGNVGSNLSELYNQAAANRAKLYEGAGTTAASMYSGLGANAANLGSAQAQAAAQNVGTSPLSLITNLAGLYGAANGGIMSAFGNWF